jgi:hypothetical protein
MPSVPPNIFVLPEPATQVSSEGATSYETIQASISGGYAYLVMGVYLYTTNIAQLTEPIVLEHYDANGNKNLMPLVPTVDPYQKTSALDVPMMKLGYVLDGQNGFYPTIKANTTVQFRIRVEAISTNNLNENSENSFQTIDLFKDFDFS